MSCLDDDLAEKDLFLDIEGDYDEFDPFDYTFDDFSLEGQEEQFSCSSADGNKTPLHDTSANMEPHFTP